MAEMNHWIPILILLSTQQIHGIIKGPEVDRPLLEEYDFVIVGSGSAGCVLANRLSEISNWKILLVEAGKRPNIMNDIPAVSQALQATDYNWNYRMEKTEGVCLGSENQQCVWPRGKGLGGSTLINYMIYNRGNRLDYDRWAEAGNPGWSYKDVLPYFKKSEKSTLRIQDEEYHNKYGLLNVEDVTFRNVIVESFIAGGRELGYPMIDYNGRSQKGFGYVQSNTKRGVRHSAYRAFIQPIENRPNLHITLNTRASRILTDASNKAYGLELIKNKKRYKILAKKEVIITAGTFNSPQILMLSGIGPKQHLSSLNITIVKDLPGVGRNLKDHITFLGLVFKLNSSVTEGAYPVEHPKSFLQWFLTGTGPLADIGGVGGIGFINTNVTKMNVPDIELIFMSGKNTKNRGEILKRSAGLSNQIYDALWKPLENQEFWSTIPMLLHPKSVGYMELKSKNPFHWPRFYGNYFSDPDNLDIKTFIGAIREIQKLAKTEAFRRYGSELHNAILPQCNSFEFDSDPYWECTLRHIAITLHHQISTCKMGPKSDPMAVVDNSGRVYGLKNLRVADTSIIPTTLSGHTSAPAFMIGEKISDIIKKDWGENV